MYQACIFCSGRLGRNEALAAFPVGRRVAFDPAKGRLWVVCGRCRRWNLAPIEERWEPVEEAEQCFRAARTRVQSENIGLARLADGTSLIRIGAALPRELAAWRYGAQLIRRRSRYLLGMGGAAVAGVALVAGMPLITAAGVPFGLISGGLQLFGQLEQHRQRRRTVLRLDAAASPTGAPLDVRRYHLWDATLDADDAGLAVRLPDVLAPSPLHRPIGRPRAAAPVILRGERAERLVARALVDYNTRGGTQRDVDTAIAAIAAADSAGAFARTLGAERLALARRPRRPAARPMPSLRQIAGTFRGEVLPVIPYASPFTAAGATLSRVQALALEMALNEASERVALEGELRELRAAWQEAEEIAAIADALPDPVQLPEPGASSRSTAAANEGTRANPSRSGSTTS